MGPKDGVFQVWSTREPMVAFLGLKNPSSPYGAFFLRHPVDLYMSYRETHKINLTEYLQGVSKKNAR